MSKRFIGIIVGAGLIATIPFTSSSHATETSVSTVGALRLQGDFSALSDASGYSYVILNSWEHDLIPQLKAANPDVRVLVYKDMSATVDYATTNGEDNKFLTAGVGYHFADRLHPDWFLRDTSGNRIEWCDYPGAWQMDVGAVLYQQTWSLNVAAELKTHGWDGVMVDDTMADPWAHLCDRKIARYPTAADYAAATESFLASVGPELTGQGWLVFPNINDADVATWKRWMSFVSGGVREWWTKTGQTSGTGFFGDNHWEFLMDQMLVTQEAGRSFIGITYSSGDDVRAMRYARASFLLGWDGGRSALIYHAGKGLDPWSPEWTMDVGTPLEPRRLQSGAWRRNFTGGTVLVNPSTTNTVTVSLEAGYVASDGKPATQITLGPTSGTILSKVLTAPTPSPTPTTATEPSLDPMPSTTATHRSSRGPAPSRRPHPWMIPFLKFAR